MNFLSEIENAIPVVKEPVSVSFPVFKRQNNVLKVLMVLFYDC